MNRASAPSYDLFKLLVTIVLVVILVLMLLRGCATTVAPSGPTEVVAVPNITESLPSLPPPTGTAPGLDVTETASPSPVPPTTEASATPTAIVATPTIAPTTSPDTAAAEPSPTVVAPETAAPEQSGSCSTSLPSRLSVGGQARVAQRLNMRNDASITAPILQTNPTNTQVEIIGGPVCTPVGDRAYLWWQIRLPSGAEGWSAEAQLNERSYLLEPIP